MRQCSHEHNHTSKRIKKGAKLATVNEELRTLKAILNKALEWEYSKTNSLSCLKYARELDSKPERFYTKDELEIIYLYAPYNWYWWKLLANTGLRRTEALQLKWEDIDDCSIKVISSSDARTKSGKWREIPLNQNLKHALCRFEKDRISDYVFPRNHAGSISRAFVRTVTRSPIQEPKGSLHCLRHTFCSNLVIAGIPLRTVQKLAGLPRLPLPRNMPTYPRITW